MVRTVLIVLLAGITAGCGSIPTVKEDPLYYTMQGTRLLDGCTTIGVSDDPSLREANPILGSQPSDGEIAAHVAGGMVLQHLLYTWVKRNSDGAEKWVAGFFSVLNLGVAARNFDRGASCP